MSKVLAKGIDIDFVLFVFVRNSNKQLYYNYGNVIASMSWLCFGIMSLGPSKIVSGWSIVKGVHVGNNNVRKQMPSSRTCSFSLRTFTLRGTTVQSKHLSDPAQPCTLSFHSPFTFSPSESIMSTNCASR